jgi:hypothetical protein
VRPLRRYHRLGRHDSRLTILPPPRRILLPILHRS